MYLIVTRSFPPELGGMQSLMWGLSKELSKNYMIKVFAEIQLAGVGNAGNLAGGISEALITTASGLSVAIPALIAHRYFIRRVDELVVNMEQEAIKLVEVVHGDREIDVEGA